MSAVLPGPEAGAAAEAPPSTMLALIQKAVSGPKIDIDTLERLLAMQERLMARDAEIAFNEAMNAAQAEMPKIVRDAKNESTNSRYARLETINNKIGPVIRAHGFSMSFGTADCPLPQHVRITCLLSHNRGHSRSYQVDQAYDMTGMKGNQNKTATHGSGSAMSYGRRYLTVLMFNITLVFEDDDGNGAGAGPTISERQVADMQALISEHGGNAGKLLQHWKIRSLEQIPAKNYDCLVNEVKALARQREEARLRRS